jgi:type VI secretion system ImpM family protein
MSSPEVLFFGKLPSHSDFVRFNAAGQEIRVFDQWLQEALYSAGRFFSSEWPAVYRDSPSYHFIFHTDHTEAALAGIVRPSHDASERKYPFIVAGRIHKRPLHPRLIPLVPRLFASFFGESLKITEEAAGGLPVSDLISKTESLGNFLAPDIDSIIRDFQGYLRSTTLERFYEGEFGSFEDYRKYVVVDNLVQIYGPSSRARTLPSSLGIRFPLSQNASSHTEEVSFWSDLGFRVSQGFPSLPNMFWGVPRGPEKSYYFLVFGKPQVKFYMSLVQPVRENGAVCRLDEDGEFPAEQAAQRLPPGIRKALESRDFTLNDLLEAVFPANGLR